MAIGVEHFDLTGRNALVLSAETPAGQAIAEAYAEAGARVTRLHTLSAGDVAQAVKRAAADMGGLHILASAADRFLAKPVITITADELAEVMMANYAYQFYACQAGIEVMRQQGQGGNRAGHPRPRRTRLAQHQRLCRSPWCGPQPDPRPGTGDCAGGDLRQRHRAGMDGVDARPP